MIAPGLGSEPIAEPDDRYQFSGRNGSGKDARSVQDTLGDYVGAVRDCNVSVPSDVDTEMG